MELIEQLPEWEIAAGPQSAGLPEFDPAIVTGHRADAHWRVIRDGAVVARCSLWWRQTPQLADHATGVIGHFASVDARASARLLAHACAELEGRNCTMAIGPMDGNTWRRYRLLTNRGDEPTFFLEPDNADDWPAHFESVGFAPIARYYSAVCADLDLVDPRLERVGPRMEDAGVEIRTIDDGRFEQELGSIHELSLISFRDNFLYSPIGKEEFIAQYRSILPAVRRELVLLAEQKGRLAGYVFAIPDYAQLERGTTINTIVVKTVAVLPGRCYAGLGNLLTARCHGAARRLGFQRAIHALMHETNESRRLSAHYAQPMRGYALYSKSLAARSGGGRRRS